MSSGANVALKNGGPTEILSSSQGLERERIERADKHGGAGRGKEQIVEDERAFARDRREQAALLEQRRAGQRTAAARRR